MDMDLKIDLQQGSLQVEGEKEWIRSIYHDFKAKFLKLWTPKIEVKEKRPYHKKVRGEIKVFHFGKWRKASLISKGQ